MVRGEVVGLGLPDCAEMAQWRGGANVFRDLTEWHDRVLGPARAFDEVGQKNPDGRAGLQRNLAKDRIRMKRRNARAAGNDRGEIGCGCLEWEQVSS